MSLVLNPVNALFAALQSSCDRILSMLLCKRNVCLLQAKLRYRQCNVAFPLGVSNLAKEQPIKVIFAGEILNIAQLENLFTFAEVVKIMNNQKFVYEIQISVGPNWF